MSSSTRWPIGLGLLALITTEFPSQQPQSGQAPGPSLDGAWRQISRSWTVGDSTLFPTAHYSQPGLLIISGKYYSLLYVFTDTPRPLLPTDRDPTDKELAQAFNNFYATGGRLERTDSTLTMYTDVAKNPNNMAPPGSFTQRWRVHGDTLWLDRADQTSSANPATARPVLRRTTYVRAP